MEAHYTNPYQCQTIKEEMLQPLPSTNPTTHLTEMDMGCLDEQILENII